MKLALEADGSPERSAVSEPIGSPSGSEAVTWRVMAVFSATMAGAATATLGARSTLSTGIGVEAEPGMTLAAGEITGEEGARASLDVGGPGRAAGFLSAA